MKAPTHIKRANQTAHIIPLSRQAVEVLRELYPLTGRFKYVFPSARGASKPMSENGVRAALRTMGYDNDTMTPHGFRGMASSLLNELGWNPDAIERQLAHKDTNRIRAAYNRAEYMVGIPLQAYNQAGQVPGFFASRTGRTKQVATLATVATLWHSRGCYSCYNHMVFLPKRAAAK